MMFGNGDTVWTVEIRSTLGVAAGMWTVVGQYDWCPASIAEARRLTSSCACGERVSYTAEDVRVREWVAVADVPFNVPRVPRRKPM